MNELVKGFFEQIKVGKKQEYKNVEIFPIFISNSLFIEHLTLEEALKEKLLIIKEIDERGSVNEVYVINKADIPVLLLDGEELEGAKQNRIINTTILLKENSKTIIPVSCTEEGRWRYKSENFRYSGEVAFCKIRKEKMETVSESLELNREFSSDQAEIWDEVREMKNKYDVKSDTCAMKDIYEEKRKDIEDYLKIFKIIDGQNGLLVAINGKIVGFDILSYKKAYKILHPKLVKSYVLEAISFEKPKNITDITQIETFFSKICECEEKSYSSIGYGKDYRYKSDIAVGSALIYKNSVIHTAFFLIEEENKFNNIENFKNRRKNRM